MSFQVINFFFKLLEERDTKLWQNDREKYGRALFMNSFFFKLVGQRGRAYDYHAVVRWMANGLGVRNIFAFRKLFIPINIKGTSKQLSHWTLAVVDHSDKTIAYYDSIGDEGMHHLEAIER